MNGQTRGGIPSSDQKRADRCRITADDGIADLVLEINKRHD
jgi:hypothetical protein